jgi:flagellar protein FlaI
VNNVFIYDPVHDRFTYTGRSQIYAEIAERRGWSRDQIESEVRVRMQVLEAMQKQGIYDYISVASLFHLFHIDRQRVLDNLSDLRQVS